MGDLEVREILRTALEVLKTQVIYAQKDLPNLQTNLRVEMETIRCVPEVQSHLTAIDELLQRLA